MRDSPLRYSINHENSQSLSDSIFVKNEFLKFFYAAMLLYLPINEVRKFWDKYNDTSSKSSENPADFYKKIWMDEKYSDADFFVRIIESIEPFINGRGLEAPVFIRNALFALNRGLLFSPKSMFKWTSPFLERFYTNEDLRYLLLTLVEYYSSILLPGMLHRTIHFKSLDSGRLTEAVILISRQHQSSDKDTFKPLPPYDCELWTAAIIQCMPAGMYLQPFEKLCMISDIRSIKQIVPHSEYHEGNLYINKKKYGNKTGFHDFCKKKNLFEKLQQYKIPDFNVTEIVEDYYCLKRKRVVLHKECIYDAPVYLYSFIFEKSSNKPKDFFSFIIDGTVKENTDSWIEVETKHKMLLDTLEPRKALCVYHHIDDSISVNGKHLVKFTPAKILRYIIFRYLKHNQIDFEYREFIKNPEIPLDTLSPNIAIRMQRLSKVLNSCFPQFKIVKTARGKISIHVNCKIEYIEEKIKAGK